MAKTFVRILILLIPLCLCLVWSRSQKETTSTYNQILDQFNNAQRYYDEATSLGSAEEYNETEERRVNQLALNGFRSVLKKIKEHRIVNDSIHFFSAFRTGELEHYFEEYQEALKFYNLSINIRNKSRLPDSLLFKPYLYAGIIYYNQNQYDSATFCFRRAETLLNKYKGDLEEKERLYNLLGVMYFQKGDYRHAGNYFRKALETLSPVHPYRKELSINYKINLAQIYFKLEDYEKANTIYQELVSAPSNQGLINEIYHNMGSIHLNLGAPLKALEYFRKVNYSTNKKIRLLNSCGLAYIHLKKYDSANIYFDSAVNVHREFGVNTDPVAYGQTLKNKGDLERIHHQPLKALELYQKAIHFFYPDYQERSLTSNPSTFSGVFSYINLFHTVVAKAEAFHELYESGSDTAWGKQELKAYQSAFNLLTYVENTYNSDESRLFIEQSKYIVHSRPIDIAYELYLLTKDKKFLEDLYVFDQQNKASVLALQHQDNENTEGGDSQKDNRIRSEISRLTIKAAQTNDSAVLNEINTKVRNLEIELGRIREKLNKTSSNLEIPAISYLQNEMLDGNTALLSYHLSDSMLTTIILTKNSFDVFQQKLFENFHEEIASFIQNIKSPTNLNTHSISSKIYGLVFNQVPLENFERLIIIPDDELNFLSFESLQDNQKEFLVEKCAVQYQYATSLLKKEKTDLSHHDVLAFAPFAHTSYKDSALEFEGLPYTLNEVESIKGERFIDHEASKQNFLKNIQDHKVIHLATHAMVNTEKENLSFIAFAPDNNQPFLLYSEEIYHLPLNETELVILSACETGSGNLVKGEGIMSLSRAFYYAGCSNIITSLWKANDFSTAYITERIHYYLGQDYSIDKAVRKAKLDYLKDPSVNPGMKHPYYWSHLVFIGNYEPERGSLNWWWLIVGGLDIVIVAFLLKKRSRKRKS